MEAPKTSYDTSYWEPKLKKKNKDKENRHSGFAYQNAIRIPTTKSEEFSNPSLPDTLRKNNTKIQTPSINCDQLGTQSPQLHKLRYYDQKTGIDK